MVEEQNVTSSQVGFIWIFGLVVIFVTGILEVVIVPILKNKVLPILIERATVDLPASEAAIIIPKMQGVFTFMHVMPYIIMFVIFAYMIISIFQKEELDTFQ